MSSQVDAKGTLSWSKVISFKVQGVGNATRIGVDVAAMGGMYADKIT